MAAEAFLYSSDAPCESSVLSCAWAAFRDRSQVGICQRTADRRGTHEQVFEVVDGFGESLFRVGDDALALCQYSALRRVPKVSAHVHNSSGSLARTHLLPDLVLVGGGVLLHLFDRAARLVCLVAVHLEFLV